MIPDDQKTDEELVSSLIKEGKVATLALSILMKRRASEIRNSINEFKEEIKEVIYRSKQESGPLLPDASEKFNKMTDEELESSLSRAGQGTSLALSILLKRRTSEIRNSLMELKDSINNFNNISEKYSKTIVRLTWVLIILTIFIAIISVIMLIK